MPNVIDLFCGCGGFSLGFERAGFDVVLGIDVWQDALDTFAFNHRNSKTLQADLSTLSPSEVSSLIGDKKIDVIIGGPPCQGFSVAGKRIVDDIRNKLYKSFVNFVEYFRPKAFVLENVPNILSIGGGIVRDAILADFGRLGYTIDYKVLTASDYGVPQNRRRAIFVGCLDGISFDFPHPLTSEKVTSEQAIGDLTEESVPDGSGYTQEPSSPFQMYARENSMGVYNHEATVHTEQTKKIIAMVPDGGNYKDLPKELWNTRKVHIAWTRLCSYKPSFTIDCGHNHHFHYKYNRVPTARESARIQSFPDKFLFLGNKGSQLRQIGNAVPPLLSFHVANALKISLKDVQP